MPLRKEGSRGRGGSSSKTTNKINSDIDQKYGTVATERGRGRGRGRGKPTVITEYKGAMTRSRTKHLEQEKKEREQKQKEREEQGQDKGEYKKQSAKKTGAKNSPTIGATTKRKVANILEQGAAKEDTDKIPAKKKKTRHEAITSKVKETEVKDAKMNDVEVGGSKVENSEMEEGEMEDEGLDDLLEVVARGCGSSRGRRRTYQNARFVPPFPFPQPETGPYDYYFCAWRIKNKN